MAICDNCIHDEVCGLEGHLDEALTFCANKVVDVQPVKRGRWEEREGYGGWGDTYYRCSVCGNDWAFEDGTPKDAEWDYCPKCGADMRGDDK